MELCGVDASTAEKALQDQDQDLILATIQILDGHKPSNASS